jgi:predicted subunit of tRNA(5-methylaminomethyl-2-thiouridylate) methyltransferase
MHEWRDVPVAHPTHPTLFSILGFVAHLHSIEHDVAELGPAIVAKACEMVCNEVRPRLN